MAVQEQSQHPQNPAKHFSIEGGRNRKRKGRILRISPLRFVLRLRLQKGGVFAGHYGTSMLIFLWFSLKGSGKSSFLYTDVVETRIERLILG